MTASTELQTNALEQLRSEITAMQTAALINVARRRGLKIDPAALHQNVSKLGIVDAAKAITPTQPSAVSATEGSERRSLFIRWTRSLFGRS